MRIPQIPSSTISEKVANGTYSLKLSRQNYNKHLEGHIDFERYKLSRMSKGQTPQSKLSISYEEAQQIIFKQSGTGIIKARQDGTALDFEYITCSKTIGYYFSHGEYHPTNKAIIYHGNKGSHLVPQKGGHYD